MTYLPYLLITPLVLLVASTISLNLFADMSQFTALWHGLVVTLALWGFLLLVIN